MCRAAASDRVRLAHRLAWFVAALLAVIALLAGNAPATGLADGDVVASGRAVASMPASRLGATGDAGEIVTIEDHRDWSQTDGERQEA